MTRIAIVTDTDASLPLELAQKYDIRQVPILVQFGEETFRAVYDINDADTFARIDETGKLPTTSAPSPGAFAEAFKEAFEAGYDSILCMTVSSQVSTTYNSALNAAELFPGKEIVVFDTMTMSMAQGFMVLEAAEVLAHGRGMEAAIAAAQDISSRTHLYVSLSTLKYLRMSGRVGYMAAGLATLFDIRPILTIKDGKLDMLERIRTQGRAWERLIELTVEASAGNLIERMAMIHVAAPESAQKIEAQFKQFLPCPDEIITTELTPGLSVHSGAGLVGVAVVCQTAS